MKAVLVSVFVLGFPSLGQYKTISSKHQFTVETGEVRWWGKSGRSIGWKRRSYSEFENLPSRIRVENSHAYLVDYSL